MASGKSKTPKSRHDTAVQGTNDSSIVSKCSMAKSGYFRDDFLYRFVSKHSRRAPLIHRGYFIRAWTIDYILKEFLRKNKKENKQIISLGAGFDSSYFRLKSAGLLDNTVYIELDFPDVVRRKGEIILQTEELKNLVDLNSHYPVHGNIVLNTNCYKLIGVDLTHLTQVEDFLALCQVRGDNPTLLVSECVLTYVSDESCTEILSWASEKFALATFVLYEQINPNDAFGQVMLNHFCKIGSPLRCIQRYPTIQSQLSRFSKTGWERQEALDMNQFYNSLVSEDERQKIERLEPFDEFEEWHLKCAHYMVLCAYNNNNSPSLLRTVTSESNISGKNFSGLSLSEDVVLMVDSKAGHDSVKANSDQVSVAQTTTLPSEHNTGISGEITAENTCQSSAETRTEISESASVCRLNSEKEMCHKYDRPKPQFIRSDVTDRDGVGKNLVQRIGHSSVKLGHLVVTVGGFGNHGNRHCRLSDVAVMDMRAGTSWTVKLSGDMKLDRMRHSMVVMETEHSILVLGGRHSPVKGVNQILKISLNPSNNYNVGADQSVDSSDSLGSLEKTDLQENSKLVEVSQPELLVSCHGDMKDGRWRHTAVISGTKVYVYGGKTETTSALGDCIVYDVTSGAWTEVSAEGKGPGPRHSHTAALLGNRHMVIVGGLNQELQPLNSVHLLDLEEKKWRLLKLTGHLKPRYSHTCHVREELLVLVGGVNLDHTPPGLAVVNLQNGHCEEFDLPERNGDDILMYHNHTSVLTEHDQLIVLGGGGNCFSFGTHLNTSPVILDVHQCLQYCL